MIEAALPPPKRVRFAEDLERLLTPGVTSQVVPGRGGGGGGGPVGGAALQQDSQTRSLIFSSPVGAGRTDWCCRHRTFPPAGRWGAERGRCSLRCSL